MSSRLRPWSGLAFFLLGIAFAVVSACKGSDDSAALLPDGGRVLAAHCTDGQKDSDETDTDCGGSCARCTGNKTCKSGSDCSSTVCQASGTCTFPSATDGVKNGNETDVDCGGGDSVPACSTGKTCAAASDCLSLVCSPTKTCAAASPTDGIKNGGESDVDCGGAGAVDAGAGIVSDNAPACAQGKTCNVNGDCTTKGCSPTNHKCVPASATDGFKDGDETDVDCGGTSGAAPCVGGQGCKTTSDCTSMICKNLLCTYPSSADGVINQGETDVDCGGPNAPACGNAKLCKQHSDCSSNGCDDSGHCALAPSCTQAHGGYSCGSGETGDPTAKHESCCIALPVTGGGNGDFLLDKYVITAGRVRQFIERNNGNIRGWVQAHYPAGWDPTWDSWLPAGYQDSQDNSDSFGGVYTQVGPPLYPTIDGKPYGAGDQGCTVSNGGARSYRLPDTINADFSDAQQYTQEIEDEKAMVCMNIMMFMAFCAWDGGHLQTEDEFNTAWGGSTYPWGSSPQPAGWDTAFPDFASAQPHAYDPSNGDPNYANYLQNYWLPAEESNPADSTVYIAPPGRFPLGAGPYGHMDLAGVAVEMTSTIDGSAGQNPKDRIAHWTKSGSWEVHKPGDIDFNVPMTYKYLATTARCAR